MIDTQRLRDHADTIHDCQWNHGIDIPDLCREAAAEIERLREAILQSGLWRNHPCVLCGYNGRGYYQAATHKCAKAWETNDGRN